jgi:phosphoribosyl 1,2-cyclic phosphodiesterase
VKVTVWGTRGSIATPGPETVRYGGNTSCVQVEGEDGSVVVLDAGTGIRRLSATLPKGLKRIDVLLTHLHMDHLQGLGFFGPLYNPAIEVHLWGPDSATLSLEARLNRYLSPPLFPVHLRELPCKMHLHTVPDETLKVGELTVIPSLLCHPGPTVGYRITSPNGTVAYIPDHEPSLAGALQQSDSSWISGFECAHDATLLIHDAQYTPEQYRKYVGWGHSSMNDAVAFARLVRAQHLLLFHHDPGHTDNTLEQMAAPYIGSHPTSETEVSLAREGDVFHIEGGNVSKVNQPLL